MPEAGMQEWIAAALSDEQKVVFASTSSHASILAAAGSGKTRTLIHLLADDLCAGVPASGIVAFTFTEKAAEELLARIHVLGKEKMPDVDLSGIFIGTIHSWCLQYLYSQSDFYNITPIDELHLDALVGRLYDALELEKIYKEAFPRAIEPFLTDIEVFYNEHLAPAKVPPGIRPALTGFVEVLSMNRLLTFGGMIRSATEHLQKSGPLAGLQSLYVDEYQDVNPAQTALIRAMVPAGGKLRVVGDDLQSIYNWRGSDVTRILEFPQEFAPAEVFRLSMNYRSRPEIVAIANHVAEDIVLKDAVKVMKPGRNECGRRVVHWISTNDEAHQAETVVEIVKKFHSEGVPYRKMAILLRSVAGAGQPIYQALQSENVPVECPSLSRGGAFINEVLLPVLNWLRTEQKEPKNNQEEADQEAYARSVWESVAPWLSAENAEEVFWSGLNRWHDLVREGKSSAYNVRSCLYDFLDECGVRIAPADTGLMVGIGIASQIIRSVEEIQRRRIKGHKRRTAAGVISEVYYAVIRNQESFGESLPVNQNAEGVMLTTVHQAKGLEWPVVILPMLNRKRFPLTNRPAKSSFPPEIAGRYGTSLDDERRLFYVAVTRARERLFMLDTAAAEPKVRSVFLTDLQRRAKLAPAGLPSSTDGTWSIAAEDLREDSPPPIRISLSDLLLYLECPYQFGLRRVTGLQPAVGDELGFGKGLHELIQRRAESGHAWSKEELASQVETHVHLPLTSDEAEQLAKRAITTRITELDQLGAFAGELQQELQVEVFLGAGVVAGVIDCVYTRPDGSLVVRDWKANIHEEFIARYARQLQFYVYALRSQNRTVSQAELVDVAASAKAKKLITVPVDITEATIATLMEKCQQALEGIREAQFQATPSASVCGSCDVRRICAAREGEGRAETEN
jgi:DNA helicase-2/ATP-dependent DNA helicase PcrA